MNVPLQTKFIRVNAFDNVQFLLTVFVDFQFHFIVLSHNYVLHGQYLN